MSIEVISAALAAQGQEHTIVTAGPTLEAWWQRLQYLFGSKSKRILTLAAYDRKIVCALGKDDITYSYFTEHGSTHVSKQKVVKESILGGDDWTRFLKEVQASINAVLLERLVHIRANKVDAADGVLESALGYSADAHAAGTGNTFAKLGYTTKAFDADARSWASNECVRSHKLLNDACLHELATFAPDAAPDAFAHLFGLAVGEYLFFHGKKHGFPRGSALDEWFMRSAGSYRFDVVASGRMGKVLSVERLAEM